MEITASNLLQDQETISLNFLGVYVNGLTIILLFQLFEFFAEKVSSLKAYLFHLSKIKNLSVFFLVATYNSTDHVLCAVKFKGVDPIKMINFCGKKYPLSQTKAK